MDLQHLLKIESDFEKSCSTNFSKLTGHVNKIDDDLEKTYLTRIINLEKKLSEQSVLLTKQSASLAEFEKTVLANKEDFQCISKNTDSWTMKSITHITCKNFVIINLICINQNKILSIFSDYDLTIFGKHFKGPVNIKVIYLNRWIII